MHYESCDYNNEERLRECTKWCQSLELGDNMIDLVYVDVVGFNLLLTH